MRGKNAGKSGKTILLQGVYDRERRPRRRSAIAVGRRGVKPDRRTTCCASRLMSS
jgi:hypothetical protein